MDWIVRAKCLSVVVIIALLTPSLLGRGREHFAEFGITVAIPKGWTWELDQVGGMVTIYPAGVLASDVLGVLQVRRLREPRLVDGSSLERLSSAIRGFAEKRWERPAFLQDSRLVPMDDYRPGMLVYTYFEGEGSPMMQAHLLTSSLSHHYLLTYTDAPEMFNADHAETHYARVWQTMTSLEADTRSPNTSLSLEMLAILLGSGAAVILYFFSRAMSGPRFRA